MSQLYPFVYMMFQLVAGVTVAGNSVRDVMDGLRQRHAAVFGMMGSKSAIFSEVPALSNRYLQDSGGSEDGFTEYQCSYSFLRDDDDFIQNAFGSNSSSNCGCTVKHNIYDLIVPLRIARPNETTATQDEIDAYVLAFNSAVGNIQYDRTASCSTDCPVCFADTNTTQSEICGMISYSETLHLRGVSGNITWENILSDFNDSYPEDILALSTATSETCIEYSRGSTGTLCLEDGFDMNRAITCAVEYNRVTCNSCTATDTCLIADCANASPSTTLDSCNMTGFIGPFVVLPLWDGVGNTTNYTLGNCDESSTRPPPAPENSTSTVTLTPSVAPTPPPAMGASPTAPPTMGEAPTAAPFTAVEEAPNVASTSPVAPDTPPTAGGVRSSSPVTGGAPVAPPLAGVVPATLPTAERAPATPPTLGAAPVTSNGCCNPDLFTVSGLVLASSMLLGVTSLYGNL